MGMTAVGVADINPTMLAELPEEVSLNNLFNSSSFTTFLEFTTRHSEVEMPIVLLNKGPNSTS